jgi:hypothetical protein
METLKHLQAETAAELDTWTPDRFARADFNSSR